MAVTGAGLLRLAEVMDKLRSPGGCPWDAEQTHESLVQYLVEETFETVDAIDSGDRTHLLEELGDVLLQVFFHARIAEESAEFAFNVDDVANGICDKLIRRHPHVFPDADGNLVESSDAATVEAAWQALKNAEKARTSVTDGVPVSLPAFTQANKLLQRLDHGSMTVPINGASVAAAEAVLASGADASDVVIALIHLLREQGVDADAELRDRVTKFRAAIIAMELSGNGNR